MFSHMFSEHFPRPASMSGSSSSPFGVFSCCLSRRKKFTKKLFLDSFVLNGAKRLLPLASFWKNPGKDLKRWHTIILVFYIPSIKNKKQLTQKTKWLCKLSKFVLCNSLHGDGLLLQKINYKINKICHCFTAESGTHLGQMCLNWECNKSPIYHTTPFLVLLRVHAEAASLLQLTALPAQQQLLLKFRDSLWLAWRSLVHCYSTSTPDFVLCW